MLHNDLPVLMENNGQSGTIGGRPAQTTAFISGYISGAAHMKAALPSSRLWPLVPVPDLPQRHMMRPHLLTK